MNIRALNSGSERTEYLFLAGICAFFLASLFLVPHIVSAYVAPTCSLSASPTTIYQSQSSELLFNSANGSNALTSCSITGYGTVSCNVSSGVFVSPSVTTTYTMNASDGTTNCTANATVTVLTPTAPSCSLSASPTSIYNSQSSTLSFGSTQGTFTLTSCSINNGVGSVSCNTTGTRSVSPSVTTTYTLSASDGFYNCTQNATVTVTASTPPSCAMTASPIFILSGQSANLAYTTTQGTFTMTSCSINNGVGSVTCNSSGNAGVSPSVTTTYTLTGNDSVNSCTHNATVFVNINPAPKPSIWEIWGGFFRQLGGFLRVK